MSVNVKAAARRELHFETLDDILADAEQVTAGPHHATGNWTAAQNLWHVAFTIGMLGRGLDQSFPLPMKVLGRVLRTFKMHVKPIKPGLNPPSKVAAVFHPPEETTLDAALQKLRDEIAYANENGMPHPSPLFGKLPPDQAVAMQCRHAELHLGFIHPTPEAAMPTASSTDR
jgi:hypothetical protein